MSGILWVQLLSPEAASAFLCQQKKPSPGSGAYHNIIHFLANGRAVNEGLVSHHGPLIALITLIQKILEELF